MTYTVIVTDGESGDEFYADFASGLGLEQFSAATEDGGELAHLLQHGWADDLQSAKQELEAMATEASQSVAASAKIFLAAIAESGLEEGVLLLSNGVSEAGDGSDEEPIAEDLGPSKTQSYLTEAWDDYP